MQPVERRHDRRIGDLGELRLQVADGRRGLSCPEGVENAPFKGADTRRRSLPVPS
jgi:hypothetical protein